MTKVIEKRKLWLISFLQYHWNFYACLINMPKFIGKSSTCDMIDHCIVVCAFVFLSRLNNNINLTGQVIIEMRML